ncbi:MAG: ROK family protein [Anaerolineales bacterium]|nr:ROK family protein [Anaerolineales bacterium]MCX7755860.1 ROK family protein [Anaerolineales bacterium]MDW8277977.1 ROK family protein [Anaerolineales bacterium]
MDILGVDVGGSGIKGAPVNTETGELLTERRRLKTPKGAEPNAVIETIADIVRSFSWHGPIGVGFPGPIKHGVVKMAANISSAWVGLNAAEAIREATGCAVTVINDADAAGLAEVTFGAGKGVKGVIIMVTLGTGIGTAIFTDGKLLPNAEFGHLKIRGEDAETRASDAARQREELSWKKYARRLNRYFREMEKLFWPDLFILGGGISKYHAKYLPLLTVNTPIVPAQFLNEAGIVGAALAARQETR